MKHYFLLILTTSLLIRSSSGSMPGRDTIFIPDKVNKHNVVMEIRGTEGQLLVTGILINGKKNGIFRSYNNLEIIAEIALYEMDLLHGVKLEFADNGALVNEENYIHGELHGRKINYRFGGVKTLSENYKNGKLDGIKITYYDTGYKQEEANYRNGLRDGISKWFNPSEIISVEYTYTMGVLSGLAKTYYYGGKVESMGNFVNDQENGEWKYYEPDGKHFKSVFFDAGKPQREVLK